MPTPTPDPILERVRRLPCWSGPITTEQLKGGLSNASWLVRDSRGAYVTRVGRDFPFHHVFRAWEQAISQAAFEAGLSPELVYREDGISVLRHVAGKTYGEADVRDNIGKVLELVRRCHLVMPQHVRGPASFFWVFHVLRDYGHTLRAGQSRHLPQLPRYAGVAAELEAAQIPLPIVYGHHDLLPGNFIYDGTRLWLIDWEYGGFGTPMFDLANIAANSSMERDAETDLLERYFSLVPEQPLLKAFDAMKAASALREAMWSMVSEIHLDAPGADYVAYTAENLRRFETAYARYKDQHG